MNIIRINCDYYEGHQGIVDAGASNAWMLGVEYHGAKIGLTIGAVKPAAYSCIDGAAWMDRCKFGGYYDMSFGLFDGDVYIKNTTTDGTHLATW